MNRRDFTALSALTMASASLAHLPRAFAGAAPAAPARPVGFAAVGLGTICDLFMRACTSSNKAKITALVTDHPDTKGAHYADLYGIPKSSIYTYDDFDRIRDNRQVEAVYIGLPNSMHRDFTLRAAQAGKHVLCEKPMAISSAECRTMIDACHKAGVKLMIAYRVQYDPTWNRALAIVKSGVIGQLQSFQGGFLGQQPPGAWRLSRT
ncbi:MAG TPA: Gfo/Idh/MocA family oxidoreductase, partial [Steroidobacteraceae bacterium]